MNSPRALPEPPAPVSPEDSAMAADAGIALARHYFERHGLRRGQDLLTEADVAKIFALGFQLGVEHERKSPTR